MKVRKFFAPSSREALRLVREALGADAVVLSNRVVDGGVELVALTEETLTDIVDERQAPAAMAPALPAEERAAPSWRDAVPARTARPASSAASAPSAPFVPSAPALAQMQPQAGRRDRTIAPPGVLAAAHIGDDGASALAYVHRGNPAPQARANEVTPAHRAAPASAPSPYDDVAAYGADDEGDDAYGNAGYEHGAARGNGYQQGADDDRRRAPAGTAMNARDNARDDAYDAHDAGAVWTPSALAAPRQEPAARQAPGASLAASAAAPVAMSAAAPARANGASASIAASRLAAAGAPVPPAPVETPSPARSIFARMFSRPSFRERVASADHQAPAPLRRDPAPASMLAHADEAAVLGLVRAERREVPQTSGVLGLGRAERTDDDVFADVPRETRET
ncbi:MAG: hypothetical protein ACRYGL_03800, partial [Janthinobacterium lividum]